MKPWRRPWFVVPVGVGLVLGLGSGALAAFSATTTDGVNQFVAAADWEPPHVTRTIIAKTPGYLGGKIRQGGQFFVYAQIDDGGNPPAGVGTVTADVSAFSTGGTAVAMTAGRVLGRGRALQLPQRGAHRDQPDGGRNPDLLVHDGRRRRPRAFPDADGIHGDRRQHRPGSRELTAANRAGGVVGRAEQGDSITYTWNEPIDPESLIAGWNGGSPTTVTARLRERWRQRPLPASATLRVRPRCNFGTVLLQRNYVNGDDDVHGLDDHDARQHRHGRAGRAVGTGQHRHGDADDPTTWTPDTAAYDAAGNAMSGATITAARRTQDLLLGGDGGLRPSAITRSGVSTDDGSERRSSPCGRLAAEPHRGITTPFGDPATIEGPSPPLPGSGLRLSLAHPRGSAPRRILPDAVRGISRHQHDRPRRLEPRDPLRGVRAELLQGRRIARRSRARRTPRPAVPTPGAAGRPPRRPPPSGGRGAPPRPPAATRSRRPSGSPRPTGRRPGAGRPASSSPASPVRSQPSSVNATAVAAGSCR